MGNKPPLNPNQLKALDMLADGVPKGKVASILRVNRTTVYGWYKRDDFLDELQRRKHMNVNVLQKAINDKAMTAVQVLEDVMMDVEAKPSDRIRAAGLILDKARPMLTEGTNTRKTETVELACWVTNVDEDGSKPVAQFIDVDSSEAAK